MSNKGVRLRKFSIAARLVEPKYHNASIIIEKDGIEVSITLPVSPPEGDRYRMFEDAEKFFRDAADEIADYIAGMRRKDHKG